MKVALKVCGMRDTNNILEVASVEPHYMGFIFYTDSPRFVGNEFKIPEINRRIKRVGVFVNEVIDEIRKVYDRYSLDLVQLHGDETPEDCQALKDVGISVIKSFAVDDGFSFMSIKPYSRSLEFVLFDTKGKYYGGNAASFNWNKLAEYDQEIPFFLSGGIGPENIDQVRELKNLNLYAIDVNSRVEVKPGVKDLSAIQSVKRAIHNFDHTT